MGNSKKHHYIPRFYLSGFADAYNNFFVYDKQTKKMWLSNPENSFLEKHRNTGSIKNPNTSEVHLTDLPEEVLAHFDGRAAQAIYEIRNSTPSDAILTIERLHAIRFFISSTFWRTPVNNKLRNEIIKIFSFKDLGFGIFDKEGLRNPETEEVLKEVDLWIKMYPTLLPIAGFRDKVNKMEISDWRIYYRGNDFHLVTDCPIILKEFKDFSSLQNELIAPLSSKHLLVVTKQTKPKSIEPGFSIKLDVLLFHTAGRYVASCDKEYLEFIIKEAAGLKPGWDVLLKGSLFDTFKE